MVEMLGTLAIMGVLSVGAVVGYRYAVDKANANAILDGVNKRALIVSQQRIVGQEVNLSEFEADIKGAYPTTAEIYADSRFFAVLVDKVPQGVCDHILREKTRFASDVFVSTGAGTGVDTCPDGESTIEFTFANDFNAGEQLQRCTKKSDCSSACEVCQSGVCVESCPTGQACAGKISYGQMNVNLQCCPTERIMNGVCCGSVTEGADGEKQCCVWSNQTTCCPPGQFYAGGQCYDCDDPRNILIYDINIYCGMCPNRLFVGQIMCASQQCPDPNMIEVNGRCHCPNDKPILGGDSQCRPCGSGGRWTADFIGMLEVRKIDPSVGQADGITSKYCGNVRCGGGYFNPCSEGQVGFCRGETFTGSDGSSVKVTDGYGKCFPCDEIQISSLNSKARCEICGGTWTGEWWKGSCTPPVE